VSTLEVLQEPQYPWDCDEVFWMTPKWRGMHPRATERVSLFDLGGPVCGWIGVDDEARGRSN